MRWLLLLVSITANAQTLVDIENLTPHAVYAMNPAVMENGDICYSSWQGYDRRGVTHTPANQWWISCMNADGTNGRVELGAHGSPHIKTREYLMDWVDPARAAEGVTEFRAVRGIVDMGNGRAAFVNYYRGNQTGLFGIIFDYVRGDAEGATLLKNIAEGVKYQTANMPGSGRSGALLTWAMVGRLSSITTAATRPDCLALSSITSVAMQRAQHCSKTSQRG